ncbi:MAG: CHAT domain-containing protein, partial [Planctomycetes bacterium]|nr:CHAT domain-containing protein [Planctomycetota bacterium]
AAARAAGRDLAGRPLRDLDVASLVALARLELLAASSSAATADLPRLAEFDAALQAQFDRMLRQWSGVPPTASGVPFLFLAVRRDLLATLVAVRLRRLPGPAGVAQCFGLLLAAEALGSTARTLPGFVVPDLGTVRAHLVPHAGLLVAWLPAPSGSFVFGLTADDAFAVALPSDGGLRGKVRALAKVAQDEPTPGWQAALAAAAAPVVAWSLPEPVRRRLEAHDDLVVVGRDLTTGIPFEALPVGPDGAELGTVKAIWSVPSMALACHYAARSPASRGHGVAVLAATQVAAREQERFGVAPIAAQPERWAAWAGGAADGGIVLAPASADDLRSGPGADARVAVVLAHGIVVLEATRPSGLLLGPGAAGVGTFLPDDVVQASDLVLLLVCRAASGAPRRGEDGGHHLGGALLQHGARNVVLADRDLELHSSQFWTGQFLQSYRAGASVAQAARDARRAVRARPEWRHPWFHASLRVEGLGHTTLPAGSRSR